MDLIVGQEIYIQSFKHNGNLHRTWCKGFVIEANEQNVIVVTNQTTVIEADGRKWQTKEPAICYFYPDRWYNVICMIRKNGIYFYCNLASPYLYDGEALKNIDYDLDIKVFPDGVYKLLDEDEFRLHQNEMAYPDSIKKIIIQTKDKLIKQLPIHNSPFNQFEVQRKYQLYIDLLNNKNK